MRKFKNGERVSFIYRGKDGNKHIGHGIVKGLRKRFYYIEVDPLEPHVKVYGNKMEKRVDFKKLLKPVAKTQDPSITEQIQTKLILQTKNHIEKAIYTFYWLAAFLVLAVLALFWAVK